MLYIEQILQYLDGKKAKLTAIFAVILNILVRAGYLDNQLATDLLSIVSILAGGAALATDNVLGKRNALGTRGK